MKAHERTARLTIARSPLTEVPIVHVKGRAFTLRAETWAGQATPFDRYNYRHAKALKRRVPLSALKRAESVKKTRRVRARLERYFLSKGFTEPDLGYMRSLGLL